MPPSRTRAIPTTTTTTTLPATPQTTKQAALRQLSALAREPLLAGARDGAAAPITTTPAEADRLALELWRFLKLKRDHQPDALPISPGHRVDDLWHLMLLQTDVAQLVHAALGVAAADKGGGIPHSIRDAARLSDSGKRARRINALNMFKNRGWSPCLAFWREPPGFDVVRVEEGGRVVYRLAAVAGATGAATAATTLATAAGPEEPARRRKRARDEEGQPQQQQQQQQQQPAAAAAVAATTTTTDTRDQGRQRQQQQPGGSPIHLYVRTLTGKKVALVANPTTTTIEQLKSMIQAKEGIPPDQQRLIFDGEQLKDGYLMADYGIVDENVVVHMVLKLGGC